MLQPWRYVVPLVHIMSRGNWINQCYYRYISLFKCLRITRISYIVNVVLEQPWYRLIHNHLFFICRSDSLAKTKGTPTQSILGRSFVNCSSSIPTSLTQLAPSGWTLYVNVSRYHWLTFWDHIRTQHARKSKQQPMILIPYVISILWTKPHLFVI